MRNLAIVAVALNAVSFVSAATLARADTELVFANRGDASSPSKRVVNVTQAQLSSCPGYRASNVQTTSYSLTADLTLAGTPCNVYGPDLTSLSLQVTYETASRIHVKIADSAGTRYQVPGDVLPRPPSSNVDAKQAAIRFNYTTNPFTFSIIRVGKVSEVLFSTSKSNPLIFEEQYLRLKTASLPPNANIYGLGEHTNTFRLPNNNFIRTLWSRDAYSVPANTNLYGNHPIYFEHRTTGTHGVFLLNSNGMDIKINQETSSKTTSIEYNVIGGILDLYFLAGPSPVQVAKQYAQIVGTPAEVQYWTLGFHQCRYGYTDYVNVMQVVANYSRAGVPLETMWTDIDYMYKRRTFSIDPQYFPLDRMRAFISALHAAGQHYVMMVDPAVAYQPNQNYPAYDQGAADNVFLRVANGSSFLGVVWPGVAVYPDWFHPNASNYWTGQFMQFFNPNTGLDIDGSWIDMNEPSNFCSYPCTDPFGQAILQGLPPPRTTPPPPPNAPIVITKRAQSSSGPNLLFPPYAIHTATQSLSDRTANTDIVHYGGVTEYNAHNLFGTMMSVKTHDALLARTPGVRPMVITRSTFAGAGSKVGKWLGDNISDWPHYVNSIAGMLGFATIYQVPMVGADICGFGGNVTPNLCARWAMLGAFGPFYRNHNELGSVPQEFYRWPMVAAAAKNAISMRYRLLDYIYTAFHQAHLDGSPVLNPLFFKYPQDQNTFGIDTQFFYGDSILVSPVTGENAVAVTIYLPKDNFYDFLTYAPIQGTGSTVHLANVPFTSIPVYIRGGAVIPLRLSSANTTAQLRQLDFEIVVAPGVDGSASGNLYVDDGVSITQTQPTTGVSFSYKSGTLTASGAFASTNKVAVVSFLGVSKAPKAVQVNGQNLSSYTYNSGKKVVKAVVSIPLSAGFTVTLA